VRIDDMGFRVQGSGCMLYLGLSVEELRGVRIRG